MKKVSAFSVFKTKKDEDDKRNGDTSDSISLKRAGSTQSMDRKPPGKSKKLMRALKANSLRQSLRVTPRLQITPKLRVKQDEKGVAGDKDVKLTSIRASNPDLRNGTPAQQMQPNISKVFKGEQQKDTPKGSTAPPIKPRRTVMSVGGLPPKGKSPRPAAESVISLKSKGVVKSPVQKSSPKEGDKAAVNGIQKKEPVKRPRTENTELPSQKRKKTSENDSVQRQDCSMEDMEKCMSFTDETTMEEPLPYMYDSSQEATKTFECLIHPVKPEKFFKELWERKPLLVKRHMLQYNNGWFSSHELDRILREEHIEYSVNLDITSYTNGVRETLNPPGRAYAPVVWDYFQNGCSIRMLNPQTYSRNVWKLLSVLQEYFGCCAGANVYMTPAGTQGFAPHYDDIEAFILQLEGKKHWRLYSPRNEAETLPRFSSNNFTDEDLGEPILDVILEPGDLLYFPRGTIHQGKSLEDAHSLHITVSCYQKNTWGDLFEKLVPQALQLAIDEDLEFRKGLPRDYLSYMGISNTDVENPQRKLFMKKVEHLMMRMMRNAPFDAACDQLGRQFIHDSLPPVLSEGEKACSVHGNGERWDKNKQRVVGATELEPDTAIKIIRKGVLRLLSEEDAVRVYHTLENARIYHNKDPQYIEVDAEVAPAVEYLIHSYPEYVSVDSLPLPTIELKIETASLLYDKGLLITGEPLAPWQDD